MPSRIIRKPSPTAWAPEAHAVTVQRFGPVRPKRIATWPAEAFAMSAGTMNGLTRPGSLLQQDGVLLEKRLDAADPGGDHDAAALGRDLRGAGVLPRQLRAREGEVRHAVGAPDLLRVEPAGGVEARHLSREVHDEVGGVEVLDLSGYRSGRWSALARSPRRRFRPA